MLLDAHILLQSQGLLDSLNAFLIRDNHHKFNLNCSNNIKSPLSVINVSIII